LSPPPEPLGIGIAPSRHTQKKTLATESVKKRQFNSAIHLFAKRMAQIIEVWVKSGYEQHQKVILISRGLVF